MLSHGARLAHREAGAVVRGRWRAAIAAVVAGFAALWLAACRGPEPGPAPERPAAEVIQRHADSLMAIPGVVGVYEGRTRGAPVIRIMLAARADSTLRRLPRVLERYRVEPEVSGTLVPMRR